MLVKIVPAMNGCNRRYPAAWWVRGIAGLVLVQLVACSARLAPALQQDPPGAPTLEQVRNDPGAYRAQAVRWGGIILDAENRDTSTWISIVALELDDDGHPRDRDRTLGRFIAVVDRFLEPMTYRRDRLITVGGLSDGLMPRKIGDFDYDYPVIRADAFYLWPETGKASPQPYPGHFWPYRHWYHPLYNPFPHVTPSHLH